MLIIKLALRNLNRHTRKTLLIGILIMFGMSLLFFVNSVFESTNQGLKSSFVRSLTGDAALCSKSDVPFGLFGVEIPIISEYENIPPLEGYNNILPVIENADTVEAWTPVVSAAASLEAGDSRTSVPVFGINPESYFSVCSDIKIKRGNVSDISSGGIFLNAVLLGDIEEEIGRELEYGEPLKLSMYSDGSFRIRQGFFAGVHEYISYTEPLDRVVLADSVIVRSIANYTLGYAGENAASPDNETEDNLFQMDDLFSDSEDTVAAVEESLSLTELEEIISDTEARTDLVMTDSGAWSFILFKSKEGKEKALNSFLEKTISKNRLPVKVLDWRSAAGMSAQAAFALQSAFYGGIIFIMLGAVLVIMNALVISVFERISEIGTMRGIGAEKSFIRRLFIAESMILMMTSSAAGIILGGLVSFIVSGNGIHLENDLLITLFGGDLIKPLLSFKSVFLHLFIAAVVGSVAWIYPVSIAMKIQPVEIMGKG